MSQQELDCDPGQWSVRLSIPRPKCLDVADGVPLLHRLLETGEDVRIARIGARFHAQHACTRMRIPTNDIAPVMRCWLAIGVKHHAHDDGGRRIAHCFVAPAASSWAVRTAAMFSIMRPMILETPA